MASRGRPHGTRIINKLPVINNILIFLYLGGLGSNDGTTHAVTSGFPATYKAYGSVGFIPLLSLLDTGI